MKKLLIKMRKKLSELWQATVPRVIGAAATAINIGITTCIIVGVSTVFNLGWTLGVILPVVACMHGATLMILAVYLALEQGAGSWV